jgi:hypothetical protein
MAWNNGFPATYQQTFPQGYPMTQNAAYAQQMAQAAFQQPSMTQQMPGTQMSSPNQPAPMLTPPTIRAEIVQVEDEQAAANFPVGAGASQMMIARDESAIFIKSTGANGTPTLEVYDRRAKRAQEGPSNFVTKEELAEALKTLRSAKEASE